MAEEALEVQELKKTGLEAEYEGELSTENTYDVEVEVPAEEGDVFIGPFPRTTFNSSGSLSFTVSEVTGLTVAALKV